VKRYFVDTNILIDLLAERKPFSKYAIALFDQAEKQNIELYTSSHSITTTHYLLKKYKDEISLRAVLFELMTIVHVISVDSDILRKSLRSNHRDFEDAIQILSASSVKGLDGIITRNIRDFQTSEISVFSPDQIVAQLKLKL